MIAVAPALAQEEAEKPKPKREPGLYATLDTSMGKIVVRLFEKEAPKTVANFVDLATGKKPWRDNRSNQPVVGKPFYDGIIFHRVIPNFMVQTGAHLPAGGFRLAENIPDEFHASLKHDRPGRLSMANAGPNTGNSQFFITTVPTPWLDGKHSIFGQVVEGQEVVVAIGNVARDANDRPTKPVIVNKVTIERVGPPPAAAQ
ncbi:MAG: peptidylprolyl isomerase [Acidobacteria bacterium]|nr:peptidylprolyl isomerase [Acidobacteriota bacterium]